MKMNNYLLNDYDACHAHDAIDMMHTMLYLVNERETIGKIQCTKWNHIRF